MQALRKLSLVWAVLLLAAISMLVRTRKACRCQHPKIRRLHAAPPVRKVVLNIARSPAVKLPKRAARNAARTVASKPKRSARQPAARLTDKVHHENPPVENGNFAHTPDSSPLLWILGWDLSSGMGKRSMNSQVQIIAKDSINL